MQLLRDYALSYLGVPYKWGGSTPMGGIDCSGLVQNLLTSVGLDIPGDQNAQAFYDYFGKNGDYVSIPSMGTLLFFGANHKSISHIAMAMDQYRMIEAGGGDHTCIDKDSAILKEAFVKISMISRRKDLLAMIKPHYVTIGVI